MQRPINRIRRTRARITREDTLYDPSLTLDELFDIFINAKSAQGLTPRTISGHLDNYRYFTTWLNQTYPNTTPAELDAEMIRHWLRVVTIFLCFYCGA